MDTPDVTDMEQKDKEDSPSVPERIKNWYRDLPDKKRYLEFVTALLTIPVLLTVLLSNLSNLQNKKDTDPAPAPTQTIVVTGTPGATPVPVISGTPQATPSPTPTPGPQCTPEVGPVTIVYPEEGDTVTGDPVCLDITRKSGNYCSVVWSYRINGGPWSAYTANSICMYGLTPGDKTLDLRVKSIVSDDEDVITRHFTVAGSTPTPATSSADTK